MKKPPAISTGFSVRALALMALPLTLIGTPLAFGRSESSFSPPQKATMMAQLAPIAQGARVGEAPDSPPAPGAAVTIEILVEVHRRLSRHLQHPH